MNNTFSAYIAAFDELNILTSTSYYSASGKDMTSKVAQIADDILSLLIRAYQQGITATADMLAYDLTVDVDSMEEAIYEVIDGKTFEDRIWEDITGYFQEYLTNDDGTKKCGLDWVAGLLEGIWDGIKNIGKWIKENVFDPFIDGFKECFGIHSPSTVMKEMGGYVVEGFLQGLNKFSEIAGKVKEWAGKVIEWFTKGEDGKGIVEHFKEIGGNIVSGFKDKVGGTYTTVKSNVTTWARPAWVFTTK